MPGLGARPSGQAPSHVPAPSESGLSAADRRASRLFAHIGFLSCLCLQRFGLQLDRSTIFISLPVFAGLLCWLLWTGRATFRPRAVIGYLAFATVVAISMAVSLIFPDSRVMNSTLSPIALLVNWAVFLVGPSRRFDSGEIIRVFIFYIRLCAVAGIIQYFIQFVGISIFSFTISAPILKPILVESTFAFMPLLEWGSTICRSNGFFLLEPSTFSQMMILGICVEYFILNRIKFLPVYGIAYLVSFSGTGMLSLLIAMPIYIVVFYRESLRVFAFAALGGALIIVGSVVLPDQIGRLTGRSAEFGKQNSSGYKRYIGQFQSVDAILGEGRALIGFGPGATDRASFVPPDTGGTIQKIIIDYGFLGLASFVTFLLMAVWRRDLGIVTLLLLSIFIFGGGMLFLSPFLIIWALLAIWSAPLMKPAASATRQSDQSH